MAEATSQLDLHILQDDRDLTVLIPANKKKSIVQRPYYLAFIVFTYLSVVVLLFRWLIFDPTNIYYPFLIVIIPLVVTIRNRIGGRYKVTDDGVVIPYLWFLTRFIPFNSIIRVDDDTITEPQNNQEHAAIRIILDTTLVKFNVSGMSPPNILLSTRDYDGYDLNNFGDAITSRKRLQNQVPNTQAQRIQDQVNRAWKNRWNIILLNVFDSTTEVLLYVLILEVFLLATLEASVWPLLGLLILGIFFSITFLFQLVSKPQAIIGIQPHELGPLIYDEEDIITTVRFVVMCHPYIVNLHSCDIIYDESTARQVGQLKQIQPAQVPSGELTYGVAQIVGNHTKAIGAKIGFQYDEKTDTEIYYEIEIKWA